MRKPSARSTRSQAVVLRSKVSCSNAYTMSACQSRCKFLPSDANTCQRAMCMCCLRWCQWHTARIGWCKSALLFDYFLFNSPSLQHSVVASVQMTPKIHEHAAHLYSFSLSYVWAKTVKTSLAIDCARWHTETARCLATARAMACIAKPSQAPKQ